MFVKKKFIFVVAVYSFCLCCLMGAVASGGERWTSQIPEPIAMLFEEPEWEEYECIDGYAHYPVKETGERFSLNLAYLIMQKDKSYTFCILEQEVDQAKCRERSDRGLPNSEAGQVVSWKFRAKTEKVLPYYEGVIPALAPLDDMSWTWVEYNHPDGYRQSFCFIRPDGVNWLLQGYTKYIPAEQVQDRFAISIDQNQYFALYFELSMPYYGNPEKIVEEFRKTIGDQREFFVTLQQNGEFLYDKQPFYGTFDLDLNQIDISSFPRTIEEVLQRLSPEPPENE